MSVEYQMIPECPDCDSDDVAQIAREPDKTAFHCANCHK